MELSPSPWYESVVNVQISICRPLLVLLINIAKASAKFILNLIMYLMYLTVIDTQKSIHLIKGLLPSFYLVINYQGNCIIPQIHILLFYIGRLLESRQPIGTCAAGDLGYIVINQGEEVGWSKTERESCYSSRTIGTKVNQLGRMGLRAHMDCGQGIQW